MKHPIQNLCLIILALACLLLLTGTAAASPVITNRSVTAFIGESNYLFLQDAEGRLHRLPVPMADLVGMDESQVYCLTQENNLYGVRLDATASSIVASNATASAISKVSGPNVYTLNSGILSRTTDTVSTALSAHVVCACTDGETIYYVTRDPASAAAALHLASVQADRPTDTMLESVKILDPVSMHVSREALTLLSMDRRVQVISLMTGDTETLVFENQIITDAICIGSSVLVFRQDEDGRYAYVAARETQIQLTPAPVARSQVSVVTPRLTAAPTPTQRPVVTARPTATPTPVRQTAAPEEDNTIYYGARGSKVRKMQQRLADLGYPVGNVDGAFGSQTLIALNLFQDAIGYTNRKSCSEKCYNRLMNKSAPAFNLYRPVKMGDRGISVQFLQTSLMLLGYGPDKADGIYGKNTASSVAKFQSAALLPVDGNLASTDTLFSLYSLINPLDKSTPVPVITPAPTAISPFWPGTITVPPTFTPPVITQVPTEAPVITPPPAPTEIYPDVEPVILEVTEAIVEELEAVVETIP